MTTGSITWPSQLCLYSLEDCMAPCEGNKHVDLAVHCEPRNLFCMTNSAFAVP